MLMQIKTLLHLLQYRIADYVWDYILDSLTPRGRCQCSPIFLFQYEITKYK